MLATHLLLAGLLGLVGARAAPESVSCAADRCFASAALPRSATPSVARFCAAYIHATPGIVTTTITGARTCTTTVTTALATTAFYKTRVRPARSARAATFDATPTELTRGCNAQQLSSACRCFLTAATTTTQTACRTTVTRYAYTGAFSCGIPNPSTATQGTVVRCSPTVPTPSTHARLRVEGPQSGEGTIFEGCIRAGPRNISTLSGGTHRCDGTNGGAHPQPGTTPTQLLDAASRRANFGYDGTFDPQVQDVFITSIDATTQSRTAFWGIVYGGRFTPTGGCQFEIAPGTTETLFAFDAFRYQGFLRLAPAYRVVPVGTTRVTVRVTNENGSVVAGADIQGGTVSDRNGNSIIRVPRSPGCYQYKATAETRALYISNAFYLTVLP